MRKAARKAAVVFLATLMVSGVAAVAAGGTAADPLISLTYINSTYIPTTVSQAAQRIDAKTQVIYQAALAGLNPQQNQDAAPSGTFLDERFKRGDVVSLSTGAGILPLAGSASVSFAAGSVVDITTGTAVASGTALVAQHRYLVAENTTALLAVSTDTAVLSLEGGYTLSPSAEIDYNALAAALKSMGIFRGTDTGFGSGFDLEKAPTRIEGLIMFLRLIGEEEAALAYTGVTPFIDVPDWCGRYVAYAYDKGYTKGVGPDLKGRPCFGTGHRIGAGEYETFLLRALGYQDSGANADFAWDTALSRATELGVITGGEQALLTGKPFLRAQVAYCSYFGLSAQRKDKSGTLLDYLSNAGTLDGVAVQSAMAQVSVVRLP